MIQVFFNDDEHTAAEGPYVRMLKARKWLYAAATLATLHSYHLLNLQAVTELTGKLVRLPDWLLTAATLSGLAYLIAQYALLLAQLQRSYKAVFRARLPDTAEITALRAQISDAEKSARNAGDDLEHASDIGDAHAAQLNLDDALELKDSLEARLRQTIRDEPTSHRDFRVAEIAIDFGRAAAPALVAIAALFRLASERPGF